MPTTAEEEVEQALAELRQNGGDEMDYKAFLKVQPVAYVP